MTGMVANSPRPRLSSVKKQTTKHAVVNPIIKVCCFCITEIFDQFSVSVIEIM